MDAKDKKFWIVHYGALGDWVLSWPSVLALRRAFPSHRFTGVGLPDRMRLAARFGIVDEWLDGEAREALPLLDGTGYPEGAVPPDGAAVWMRGAEGLLRLLRKSAGLPVAEVEPVPENPARHIARLYRDSLSPVFGLPASADLAEGFPETLSKAQAAFIHPGAGHPRKTFAPGFYLSAAKRLRASGFSRVVILLGPAEIERGLDAAFRGEETVMPPDASGLADWLENAAFFMGNDSGPSHLAGFMGIPSVVFYRDTDPEIWGVLGRQVRRIRAGGEDEAMEKFLSAG